MQTPNKRPRRAGFTLIELLTVVAIIGILAAILVPTVGGVRASAARAKTRAQFAQWASAMELFKQEYGFYPAIDAGTGRVEFDRFVGALTGRNVDGSPVDVAAEAILGGNRKRIPFLTLAEGDLNGARTALVDAFGNESFAVLYDRDDNRRITAADCVTGGVVAVQASASGRLLTPSSDQLDLASGVMASVIFYSAGRGESPEDLVFSWK